MRRHGARRERRHLASGVLGFRCSRLPSKSGWKQSSNGNGSRHGASVVRTLLLAAGLGGRLRPLTNTVPKCLAPTGGKPLLGYWLELLLGGGIERVLVNTHHLPEPVRMFVAA